MKNNSTFFAFLGLQVRRYWPGCLLAIMIALLWARGSLVYAAPLHQTVPPPTATQVSEPVPTATPVPDDGGDDDDDDDGDNEQPGPTWTPTTQPQPEATQSGPTQPEPTQVEPTQAAPTPTAGALTGVVTVARLNVREGPGTTYGVVGTAISGQTVTILSRNPGGDWWHICCANGTDQVGWVAAQYIQANFDLGQASTLIAVDEALPAEPTPTPTIVAGSVPTTTTALPLLELQLQQEPPYAWQGEVLTLIYQISNRGEVAATAVELRNELPAELTFVGAPTLAAGEFMTETTDLGRTVVVFRWPELQAGATATANVQVQVAEGMADGIVIDNLAAVVADGVQPVTNGISIGLPPTTLPDFR